MKYILDLPLLGVMLTPLPIFVRLTKELVSGSLIEESIVWEPLDYQMSTSQHIHRHQSTFQTIQLIKCPSRYQPYHTLSTAREFHFLRGSTSIYQELLLYLEGPVWMLLALERDPFNVEMWWLTCSSGMDQYHSPRACHMFIPSAV